MESISGFYINPDTEYEIERTKYQIRFGDKTFKLEPGDLVRTESDLYLFLPTSPLFLAWIVFSISGHFRSALKPNLICHLFARGGRRRCEKIYP